MGRSLEKRDTVNDKKEAISMKLIDLSENMLEVLSQIFFSNHSIEL